MTAGVLSPTESPSASEGAHLGRIQKVVSEFVGRRFVCRRRDLCVNGERHARVGMTKTVLSRPYVNAFGHHCRRVRPA